MLYIAAGVVIVVCGSGLILGLAALMIAGSCSEGERQQELLARTDPHHWGSE